MHEKEGDAYKSFDRSLQDSGLFPLAATDISVFQINFGKLCNQACLHCHVEAGPQRTENISKETLDTCLSILKNFDIPTVDITGGAPEMNPHFRWFVRECTRLGKQIMVRSNLTVIFEPGQQDLPEFYADNRVELISSLPYFLEKSVDSQRGRGVFQKSIQALVKLNSLSYGMDNSDLILNLVYNPNGAFLPPAQGAVEKDFKRELKNRYGISFNNLFTITNMPIGRFKHFLERTNNYQSYLNRLINAYNPQAAEGVMCRYTLSIGWDGTIYDCDFNQMLGLNCDHGAPGHLNNFDLEKLRSRRIVTGLHCYGCTAGAGSSCGGAVVENNK